MNSDQNFDNTEELESAPLRVEIRCVVPPSQEQREKIAAFMKDKYDAEEVEIVVPSDLSDILPKGQRVSLGVVAEKINVFDRKTKNTLIPEGA